MLAARNKINEEFKKNKHVQNEGSIDELVKMAIEVENELKGNVIQAKEKEPGVYGNDCAALVMWKLLLKVFFSELNITKDTTKLDNVMFDENAVLKKPRPGAKRCK